MQILWKIILIYLMVSQNIWATQGTVKLVEDSANGSNYSGIKAAASISTDTTWIWPPAEGAADQVLSTNGSGTLGWATPVKAWTPVSKSSNYSILSTDKAKFFLVTGTTTMTLPNPTVVGSGYMVGFNNSGAGTVTVNPFAAETINGSATLSLSVGSSATLITDGTNWFFFNRNSSSSSFSPCSPTDIQIFNSTGTWTKPTCGTATLIQCWGGGGGGGGQAANKYGGGGGGGAFNSLSISTSSLGSTETVTIGAGGAGGAAAGGASGSAGGTSTFGAWLSAYGGGGGVGGNGTQDHGGGGGGGGQSSAGANGSTTNGGAGGNASGGAGGTTGAGANALTNSGALFASTISDAGGAAPWSNISNASTSDNSYATRAFSSSSTNNVLTATGFSFSIPTNTQITGIVVEWEKKSSTATNARDGIVKLVKNGAVVGTDKATATAWPTADTFISYGSSSDLWGQSWTPADINSANFGAAISGRSLNATARTLSIDSVKITVYYYSTGGGGGGAGSTSVLNGGGLGFFGGGGGGGSGSDGFDSNYAVGGSSVLGGGGGGGGYECCFGGAYGSSVLAGRGGYGSGCATSDAEGGQAPAGGGGGSGECGGGSFAGGAGADGRCVIITQ